MDMISINSNMINNKRKSMILIQYNTMQYGLSCFGRLWTHVSGARNRSPINPINPNTLHYSPIISAIPTIRYDTIRYQEPSTGMDPIARRFMWDIISRMTTTDRECSVILTTHSMEEAESLCNNIGIMVRRAVGSGL